MVFYDRTRKRRYLFWIGLSVCFFAVSFSYYHLNKDIETSYPLDAEIENLVVESKPKQLILTFDDGPHPRHTREIIEILEERNIPAIFFFVGENMLEHPDVVREVYEAGHEIGNHTYSHAEEVHITPLRIKEELYSTNRLIEHYTGHRSIIYRPPFLLDLKNETREIILKTESEDPNETIQYINSLGYIIVGSRIDSYDWNSATPGEILSNTTATLEDGNIVLLHDGGLDRTLTVETLPFLLDELSLLGYEFVSLADYLGVEREKLMPPAPNENLLAHTEHAILGVVSIFLTKIVPVSIVLLFAFTVGRILFLFLCFLMRSRKISTIPKWEKGVSVLVPAFNEENNIEGTILSILKNNFNPMEIIVIDDGSTDRTSEIVTNLIARVPDDITLIRIQNGGKAKALNIGLKHSKYEVFIAIDGDTVVHENALAELSKHFTNPNVGAVAGKIYAISAYKILSVFQDLEYVVGQNIDKTAFSYLGAVSIIPGAIGAWRKSDVKKVGGYSSDTLVEDQDLTFAIHELGKEVLFEPKGIAYTEVPTSITSFFRQRFRWIFGGLQCLFKYKSSLCSLHRPSLGWVILPYNTIFMVIIPILWPIALWLIASALVNDKLTAVLISFFIFFLVDFAYVAFALKKEGGKWYLIYYLMFQRLFYRVIVTLVIFLAFIKALQGTNAKWNKADRVGDAKQYFEAHLSPLPYTAPGALPINS